MITTDYEDQMDAIEAGASELPQPNGTREEYCSIDLDTREISIPDCFKTIAVYSDHQAETLWFTADRYFDNTDLGAETVSIAIIYQGANGIYGKDYAIGKDIMDADDKKIVFGWTIRESATQYPGELLFGIRFYKTNDSGTYTYKLNTKINGIIIERGLDYAYDNFISPTADALDGLAARVGALENYIEAVTGDGTLRECYNYVGECLTAASEPDKAVTVNSNFVLEDKVVVTVRFKEGLRASLQTNSHATLNVNDMGSYDITINGVDATSIYDNTQSIIQPGGIVSFMYLAPALDGDEGVWTMIGNQYVDKAMRADSADKADVANSVTDGTITKNKLDSELKFVADMFAIDDDKLIINDRGHNIEQIEVEPIVHFNDEVNFHSGTVYMRTDLDIENRTPVTFKSGSMLTLLSGVEIDLPNGTYTPQQLESAISPPVSVISTAAVSITAGDNTEYRCTTELTSLTFNYPSSLDVSDRFCALINFKTGSAVLSVDYEKPLVLSGSNVTAGTVDGSTVYVFDPQPNYKYTLGLMWDGEIMNGVIRGTEYVTTE